MISLVRHSRTIWIGAIGVPIVLFLSWPRKVEYLREDLKKAGIHLELVSDQDLIASPGHPKEFGMKTYRVLDNQRDAFGAMLLFKGYSHNHLDPTNNSDWVYEKRYVSFQVVTVNFYRTQRIKLQGDLISANFL